MDTINSSSIFGAKASDVVADVVGSKGDLDAYIRIGFGSISRTTIAINFDDVGELRKFVAQAAEALRKHDESIEFAEHLDREKREDFAR